MLLALSIVQTALPCTPRVRPALLTLSSRGPFRQLHFAITRLSGPSTRSTLHDKGALWCFQFVGVGIRPFYDFVQSAVLNAELDCGAFYLNECYWRSPGTFRRSHDVIGERVFNLCPNCFTLVRRRAVR